MRVLWITTKPPWPPADGGRLLVLLTLRALADLGLPVSLVCPFTPGADDPEALRDALRPVAEAHPVAAARPHLARALLRSQLAGSPLTVARHDRGEVRTAVERLLAPGGFDVVHVEQLQALRQAEPALARGLPVVLRAQNVESDLWRALAARGRGRGWIAAREARRLAQHEGTAVRRVARTVALTGRDADRLRVLAGGQAVVEHVPAPFPDRLEALGPPLPGDPALVVLAGGWLPNREGAEDFVRRAWPLVRSRCPRAVLHVFGEASAGAGDPSIRAHPSPPDSRLMFGENAVLVVPLSIASGVRMKILESWARGVPVVATPEAVAGLEESDAETVLVARSPADFARAIGRVHADRDFAAATVEAGRAVLRRWHAPAEVARRLRDVYARTASRAGRPRPR